MPNPPRSLSQRLKLVDGIEMRFKNAYLKMVKVARYRPEAPSDGFGNVLLSKDDIIDESVLQKEAIRYANRLKEQDDSTEFTLHGCTNWQESKLFVYLLNACELCFTGNGSVPIIKRLLELSLNEIKAIEANS